MTDYEPKVQEFMQAHNLSDEDLKAHSERQDLANHKECAARDSGDDDEHWLLAVVSGSDLTSARKIELMEHLAHLIATKNKYNNMIPELIEFEDAMQDLDRHQNFPRTIRNEFYFFKEIMRRWS